MCVAVAYCSAEPCPALPPSLPSSALVAANLPFLAPICRRLHQESPLPRCVATRALRLTLRGLLLPLAVVWLVELRARRLFAAAVGRQRL